MKDNKNVTQKNLVLITSVINTVNKPLSYFPHRSVYSKKERFEQTLKSIESVRKYMPNSYIYMIECSNDIEEEEEKLKQLVDTYVNCFHTKNVRDAVQSPHKGIGEMNFLLYFLNSFDKLPEFNHFFKISGRYRLNDKFNFDKFKDQKNIFKQSDGVFVTIFYKIDREFYDSFKKIMKSNIRNVISVEMIFKQNITEYKDIDYIGVEGNVFDGTFILQ